MVKVKPFRTEADLCARFIAALPQGWTAYAECRGWDILLVRVDDGFQVGIQAKLRLNTDVVSQAIEEYAGYSADRAGPDCRAVLVPSDQQGGFTRICRYIGLTIIYVQSDAEIEKTRHYGHKPKVFEPGLPGGKYGTDDNEWYEWAPAKRHDLPDYVPDVVAGSPAPVQLTGWKIAAIKIAIVMEKRGYLVRADFKHINIDHRRWLASGNGWLIVDGGVYVASAAFPDFKLQHPRNYLEIAADYERWKPADPIGLLLPKQETLAC